MFAVRFLIGLTVVYVFGSTYVVQSVAAETPESSPLHRPEFVPGEALIKFKPEVSKERIAAVMAEMKVELIAAHEALRLYHVRILSSEPVEAAVRRFSLLPEVEYAESNYIRKQFERLP